MLRLVSLLAVLPGCFLVFDGGDDEPPVCLAATDAEAPEYVPAPLRDPGDLTCDSFGTGCDPACGPCPEAAAALAPIPSWNYCGHRCETLGEGQCAADPECRVVKDARCSVSYDCETDFLGCFPVDTQPDPTVDCFATFDAWDCSRSNACTAMHYSVGGPPNALSPEQRREFAMCVPEGATPGSCWAPVACDALPPECPSGTTPGVTDLCWTGGCIPLDVCEPRPNE